MKSPNELLTDLTVLSTIVGTNESKGPSVVLPSNLKSSGETDKGMCVLILIDSHLRNLGSFIDSVLVDVHAIELVQQLIFLRGILYPWQSEV